MLGRGEFGVVEEVAAISLSSNPVPGEITENCEEGPVEMSPPGLLALSRRSIDKAEDIFSLNNECDCSDDDSGSVSSLGSSGGTNFAGVRQDRAFMSEACLRLDKPRYAIKRIRTDLDEDGKVNGIIDLALEAHFLAVLNHPNIIHLRATSSADPISSKYFLILDRLQCTIEEKILEWSDVKKKFNASSGGFFSKLKKKSQNDWNSKCTEIRHLLLDRVLAMYDISRAMRYIHNHE